MAAGKEIRSKIRSVQNTRKITKAMEMVAASKMRKAQDRMQAARPYAEKVRAVAAHLAHANPEYRHPYLTERPIRRVGYLVISTDRGLCGGLNANLFRALIPHIRQFRDKGITDMEFCTVGKKALAFFRRLGGKVVAAATDIGDLPDPDVLRGPVRVLIDAYEQGKLDRVFIVRNEFVNTMVQRPQVLQLLPAVDEFPETQRRWDYLYEPSDAKELLDALLLRYLETRVYRGVVENIACEMAARMVAMKSASENASNLISELQLIYNKARQAAITRELSEIVAGAAAV